MMPLIGSGSPALKPQNDFFLIYFFLNLMRGERSGFDCETAHSLANNLVNKSHTMDYPPFWWDVLRRFIKLTCKEYILTWTCLLLVFPVHQFILHSKQVTVCWKAKCNSQSSTPIKGSLLHVFPPNPSLPHYCYLKQKDQKSNVKKESPPIGQLQVSPPGGP